MDSLNVDLSLENSRLRAIVAPDGGLSITDRANGKRWETRGPAFVLHLWNRMMDRPLTVMSGADECEVERRPGTTSRDGAIALRWPKVEVSLVLELTLRDEDALQVRLRPASIREGNHQHLRLMGLEVWPDFGAAAAGQAGYILLPSASGALCTFAAAKTQPAELRRRVYLDQGEWEAWYALPVFGMRHEEGAAYACILEQGEWDAQIVARLHAAGTDRHTVHAHWHLRAGKADAFDPIDRVFRYVFLSGVEADYAGMAKAYRRYLLAERGAALLRDRAAARPALATEVRSHTCKVFMGSKRRQADGRAPYDRFTTFDQAIEVMDAFRAAGLAKVSYQFVGWNIDGHDGQYPTRFPVDERVGGEAGLTRFLNAARAAGHTVGVHDNYIDMEACSPDWDESVLMADRDGEPVIGGIWSGGQTWYICGSQALRFARRDLPRMRALGLTGICYLDAMPRVSRACHAAAHGHQPGRRADGEGVVALLRYARETMGGLPIGCENAMGYTIADQDYTGHLPMKAARNGVPAEFADEWVPFFQIAVHGLIKYHLGDPRQGGGPEQAGPWILKEIEYGALPRFEYQYRDTRLDDPMQFHFGDWRPWLPVLTAQHRILCQELVELQWETIDRHWRDADGISHTAYANGTVVHVDHQGQRHAVGDGPWQPLIINRSSSTSTPEPKEAL